MGGSSESFGGHGGSNGEPIGHLEPAGTTLGGIGHPSVHAEARGEALRSHRVTIGQSWGGRVGSCWGTIFELSGHWEPWGGGIRRHGEATGEPSGDREVMENAQGFLHYGFRMPSARDERCHILRGIAAGGMYRRITRGFALSRLLKLLSQNVCGYPGG